MQPYIYQMISVCEIRDNSTLVFVDFSDGAADRVFRMPVRAARRRIPKGLPADVSRPQHMQMNLTRRNN